MAAGAAPGLMISSHDTHTSAARGACARPVNAAPNVRGVAWSVTLAHEAGSATAAPPASKKTVPAPYHKLADTVGMTASPRYTAPASNSGSSPDLTTVVVLADPVGPSTTTIGSLFMSARFAIGDAARCARAAATTPSRSSAEPAA